MTERWLHTAYQLGVPTTFVVDAGGSIAWIGHPMDLKATLGKALDGAWASERDRRGAMRLWTGRKSGTAFGCSIE